MTDPGPTAWWRKPETFDRWSRDLLHAEMSQLRPGGWRWPTAAGDVNWIDDAGADSLELMALSSAWAERLDLRHADELEPLTREPTWRNWQAGALVRLQRGDAHLRFASSGSTGRVQTLLHPLAELQQEVACIAERLLTNGPPVRRIVSVVRAHHLYGFLFTVLLPMALAQALSLPDLPVVDAVQDSPALTRHRLQPGDLVVAFPDWWAQAARGGTAWPAGITGVSSTAPCPIDVARAAREAGVERWVEVYGSTETAGVGWRENPEAPFELQPYWVRADHLEPALASASSTDSTLRRRLPQGGWSPEVSPPDRLHWLDAHHFRPTGRRDGVVQVGGVNVDPQEVRRRLVTHPRVADAAVRLHGEGAGQRLKAFVVPVYEGTAPKVQGDLAEELHAWCGQQFVPAARPVHIRVGPELPRNEMGKLCDWSPHA